MGSELKFELAQLIQIFLHYLYMFLRYFRIYQSLISCIDHLYKFIFKVFNKLVLSNVFHVCGAGIIDSVMAA